MKKYIFLFILVSIGRVGFSQHLHVAAHYQPPQFNDPNRIEKIRSTLSTVDKIFKEYAEKNHFPGLTYAIVADGKIIYSGVYGYTNVAEKTPVSLTSAFRVASMTKSFTTLAILQLRDKGKLKLDDPVYLYVPQMKNQKKLTKDAPAITIRQLMTHSSGLPEDNPWGDRRLADTDKELTNLLNKGLSFSTTNGTAYEYSNLGFTLLGAIIKKVSGKPYDQYITESILHPLGMKNTYWEYEKVSKNKLAQGYRWINGEWREEELLHHGSWGAMGGLISTMEDYAKYVTLHLSAWPPRDEGDTKIISRSSVREMHQPWRFIGMNVNYKYPSGRACALASAYGYGLGWAKDCEGRILVRHSGGLPGFGSNWTILPEYGIGIISFANVTYAPASLLNTMVLDTLLKLSNIQKRVLPPSAILQQRKNELVKLLPTWEGAGSSGILADNFLDDYPIDSLRKKAGDIFSNAGKIISVSDVSPENQLRGSFIMEGEKSNIEIRFTLTSDRNPTIQEYSIREIKK